MKKGVIITASVLIVLGIALFAGALISSGSDLSIQKYVLGRAVFEGEAADFSKIRIIADETDITVKPSEDGKATVVYGDAEKFHYNIKNSDGTLEIELEDTRSWAERISLFSKTRTMTVYLPKTHYDLLLIDSGTGDVSLSEQIKFGEITVTSSTGDIECGASSDGRIALSASTGDIDLINVRAKQISLSVSTGKVAVSDTVCEDELFVKVSTGKTVLSGVECKDFRSEGSTGKISLGNTAAENSIKIERGTGDITFDNCDAETITVTASTGDVKGTLRTGKIFNVKTSTGRIRVPESVSGGRCDITTTTGDIDISVIK
jgi:DUF4097 and DUF4098 domain-containing protein YvlB